MITARTLANVGWLSLVNLLWASQFPAYKFAAEYMSVNALSLYTFLCAIAILMPFLAWERRKAREPRSAEGQSSWRSAALDYFLLGLLGLVPPSIMMSWGIQHSSGSNAAILTLTIPLLMVTVAVPLLGEGLTWTRVAALALALLGAAFISKDDIAGSSFTSSTLIGNLLIFAACLGSAFYNIYSKRLLSRHSELEVLIYGYAAGAVLCALASTAIDTRPFYEVREVPVKGWVAILILGSLSWGIGMVLFMWLLRRLDIALISVSIYLLSFFGVLLSALALGERVRPTQLLGGIVVFAAAVMSDSYERRAAKLSNSA
jgi:drug/metabolite transporter (DMT)-like permease